MRSERQCCDRIGSSCRGARYRTSRCCRTGQGRPVRASSSALRCPHRTPRPGKAFRPQHWPSTAPGHDNHSANPTTCAASLTNPVPAAPPPCRLPCTVAPPVRTAPRPGTLLDRTAWLRRPGQPAGSAARSGCAIPVRRPSVPPWFRTGRAAPVRTARARTGRQGPAVQPDVLLGAAHPSARSRCRAPRPAALPVPSRPRARLRDGVRSGRRGAVRPGWDGPRGARRPAGRGPVPPVVSVADRPTKRARAARILGDHEHQGHR